MRIGPPVMLFSTFPTIYKMSNLKNDKPSRRKFLSFGLLGSASLLAGTVNAQTPIEEGEKVKMLTPDGQLVEVDKSIFDAAKGREKANNEAILNWSKAPK